jgi:hypothetical protein
MRTASASGEKWQRQVIKYDREGPGILGYYLDTVGLLASLCPLVVEVRQKDGTWMRSDDPVLAVALAGYQSKLVSQPDLVASMGADMMSADATTAPQEAHGLIEQLKGRT